MRLSIYEHALQEIAGGLTLINVKLHFMLYDLHSNLVCVEFTGICKDKQGACKEVYLCDTRHNQRTSRRRNLWSQRKGNDKVCDTREVEEMRRFGAFYETFSLKSCLCFYCDVIQAKVVA